MSRRTGRTNPLRWQATVGLVVIAAVIALVIFLVVGRSGSNPSAQEPEAPSESPSASVPQEPSGSQGASASPAVSEPPVSETSAAVPEPGPEPYDFSRPVPESDPVEDSYFEDAVFVGDSRTEGFMLYSGVPAGDSLTHTGLSIFDVRNDKTCITVDGQEYTLPDAIDLKQYGKIYLCLGVNELGYDADELFYEAFCELVERLREDQPQAVIYLQTLIPLNEEAIAESGGRDYLKNDHLRTYNQLIAQVAEECRVALVDVYSDFADENGSLPREASNDGVHMKGSYCVQWLDYLRTHTVSYETLYPEGAESE